MRNLKSWSLGALGAALVVAAAPAHAGITYLTQERSVTGSAHALGDVETDTETAPDVAQFGGSVDVSIERFADRGPDVPPNGVRAAARVSQLSELLPTGITTSGDAFLDADDDFEDGGERAELSSLLTTTFRLDQAYDFEARANSPDGGVLTWRYQLLRGDGSEVFSTVHGSESSPIATGTLEAGDYTFHADFMGSVVFDREEWHYVGSLALTPQDAGPGPSPVPLPPGAWPALATAAGYAATHAFRRRRRV